MFSLQVSKISDLKQLLEFTDSFSIIAQIRRYLLNQEEPNRYLIYTDNFFTNVKLCKYLKKYRIRVFGTAKAGLRFLIELFIFDDILFKKSNRGFLQTTTIKN